MRGIVRQEAGKKCATASFLYVKLLNKYAPSLCTVRLRNSRELFTVTILFEALALTDNTDLSCE
jgi:hypothetical protein